MGTCFGSKENPPIELLLLGLASSGKSTFTKQLRFENTLDFTEWELENFKLVLHSNVRQDLLFLVGVCGEHDIELPVPALKHVRALNAESTSESCNIAAVTKLWAEPAIQKAYQIQLKAEASVLGNHFLKQIPGVLEEKFQLTEEDIIHLRFRSTGLQRTTFKSSDSLHWIIADAGGQPSERQKWGDVLEKGKYMAVLYMVAMNEFDIVSDEDPKKSRLEFSIGVFQEFWKNLLTTTRSQRVSCILILNKMDLFEGKFGDKLEIFKKNFPGFEGETVKEALEFISKKFLDLGEDVSLRSSVMNTCCLKKELTVQIFEEIKHFVTQKAIDKFLF